MKSDLFEAVFTDSISGVKQALSRGDIDINQENGKCFVLHTAAAHASPEVVETLLDQGASLSSNVEGCTALHCAASLGKIANICLLLSRGAEIEAVDALGKTPLFTATVNGQVQAIEVLAAKGADVNHRARLGITPLHYAIKEKRLDTVKVLLRVKADITIRLGRLTALEFAISCRHTEIAEELVLHGNVDDDDRFTTFMHEKALTQAALMNMPLGIEKLYATGARDPTGEALCVAISKRHVKCVQALLKCIAINSCVRKYINNARLKGLGWLSSILHGRTPSTKIVRLLVDAGADTTSAIGVQWGDSEPFESTPAQCLQTAFDADSTESGIVEEHLGALKGILRIFQQVPAVHATSWLWPKGAAKGKRVKKSSVFAIVLPILKKRAKKRHVLLAALTR